MTQLIPQVLSALVVGSNALFIIALALFAFSGRTRAWIMDSISRHGMWYVFVLSATATVGSLALSNIVGFPPCNLCWIQRLFMYPQVIISGAILFRRKSGAISARAVYWLLSLSVIGLLIAAYHSYTQWGGEKSLLPCVAEGGACGKLYIYAYNYVTIPFMALSAFVYLTAVLLVAFYVVRKNRNNGQGN